MCLVRRDRPSPEGGGTVPLSCLTVHLQSANLAETSPVEIKEGSGAQAKNRFAAKDGENGESKQQSFVAFPVSYAKRICFFVLCKFSLIRTVAHVGAFFLHSSIHPPQKVYPYLLQC